MPKPPKNNNVNTNPENNIEKESQSEIFTMEPFASKEEAKRYLGYMKPFYNAVGVELTDEKMNQILDAKPDGNWKIVQDIQELNKKKKEMMEKYKLPVEDNELIHNDFHRVYGAMLKIGDTKEIEEYNLKLQKQAKTQQGQLAICKAAMEQSNNLNTNLFVPDDTTMLTNYLKHYQEFNMAFICECLLSCLNAAVGKNMGLAKDDAGLVALREKKLKLEVAGGATAMMNAFLHPLSALLPKNLIVDEAMYDKSQKDDFFDASVPTKAVKQIQGYIAAELSRQFTQESQYRDIYNEALKKKYQIQNVFTKGEIVFDEKNHQIPKDSFLEYGKNYMVMNQSGIVKGFCFKRVLDFPIKPEIQPLYAKVPDKLEKAQQRVHDNALSYICRMENYENVFRGLMGPKLIKNPFYAQYTPELKNCDYTLPEDTKGMSEELAECLTLGTLLDSKYVQNMSNGSTKAGESLEAKTEALALDWFVNDDVSRFHGDDTALAEVRKQMPAMLKKLAGGDNKDAKIAFNRIAEIYSKITLESNSLPDMDIEPSKNTILPMMVCEKLAGIIENNPFDIATDMDPVVKSAILMRANAYRIYRKEGEATLALMSNPNLPEEQKQKYIKEIAVAKILRSLQKQAFSKMDDKDMAALKETILKDKPNADKRDDENPQSDYGYAAHLLKDKILTRNVRFYHPSDIDLALAQKPEKLEQAIVSLIPDGTINQLAACPPQIMATKLDGLTADGKNFVSPEVEKLELPQGIDAKYKQEFVDEVVSYIGQLEKTSAENDKRAENVVDATKLTDVKAGLYCDELCEKMKEDINRTRAGITGSSDAFQAVEDAIDELPKSAVGFNDVSKFANAGIYCAYVERIIIAGNNYLAEKKKEGINADTKGRPGERYQNVQKVVSKATRMREFAENTCNWQFKSLDPKIGNKDVLRLKDCREAVNLLENLKLTREVLDQADPFYIKSSTQFKDIQETLDDCIKLLGDYGKEGFMKEKYNNSLQQKLADLEKQTQQYMKEKANPSSLHGKNRMYAITRIHQVVEGAAQAMKSRDEERHKEHLMTEKRTAFRQVHAEKKAREKAAKVAENTKKLEGYNERMASYKTVSLQSAQFDKQYQVEILAHKVRMGYSALDNQFKNGTAFYEGEKKLLKPMVADRMILDMIQKERTMNKDAILEKVYVQHPTDFKKYLLQDKLINSMMDQYLRMDGEPDATNKKLEAYDEKVASTLTLFRTKTPEFEKLHEADHVKDELKSEKELKDAGDQILQ